MAFNCRSQSAEASTNNDDLGPGLGLGCRVGIFGHCLVGDHEWRDLHSLCAGTLKWRRQNPESVWVEKSEEATGVPPNWLCRNDVGAVAPICAPSDPIRCDPRCPHGDPATPKQANGSLCMLFTLELKPDTWLDST